MEPLESLRYLNFLSLDGAVVTAITPVQNIPDYPPLEALLDQIRKLPRARLVDGERLAREAGSARATNMVMVGAASRDVPVPAATLERFIEKTFAPKGAQVAATNLAAFRAGREAAL
jgi:indolepyruvate ferredoxin oxidoreductase beta subunit